MEIGRRILYNAGMGRIGIRLLVIAVVATCLACPILQAFDHWDHAEAKGKDTESTFMVVAVAVGLAIPVASVMWRSTATAQRLVNSTDFSYVWNELAFASTPIPVSQPPPNLRI